jgi:Rhodopirellula transposase DDE domain
MLIVFVVQKKESLDPNLITTIDSIVSEHSQIDPSFKTQRCYVRLTSRYILKELLLYKGYDLHSFCNKTVHNVLNRLGYTLKKVLKTKPARKVPETDAIFANVARQHTLANADPRILRISIDTKAKVKIGNLSRGGYSRLKNAPKADDHDHKSDATLVPFGIYELNTDNVFLIFGQSHETADFILDALEQWWIERQFMQDNYDVLMIDLDNGTSVASSTKQFMKRITAFAKKINMPIQLVYYPPYHSKYNPIERVWAALENYWKPLILDTIDNALKIAAKMTWKGMNPIVSFIDKIYQTGIKISDEEFEEISPFIQKNPDLKKWDVKILNKIDR